MSHFTPEQQQEIADMVFRIVRDVLLKAAMDASAPEEIQDSDFP
jgi:hypothetical protein